MGGAAMKEDLKETKPAASSAGRVKVGDIVTREPITFSGRESKKCQPQKGKVVYIHPRGRYHVVEFACEAGTIREAFQGVMS